MQARFAGSEPSSTELIVKCCPEAQADGVPCPEIGRDCEICERAIEEVRQANRTEPVR